jgi:hypothetical protein
MSQETEPIQEDEPNLDLYAWLQELAELAALPQPTEQDRERSFELADNVITLLDDGARMRLEHGGGGPGHVVAEDLVELEQHCEEIGPKIGYPRSAEGARVLIERRDAEIAHIAGSN